MDLQEIQNWVKQDWQERSKIKPSVELQLLYLMEELGEVAECIRKLSGNKDRKQLEMDLGSEMADLLISLITLANTFDIVLTSEVQKFQMKLQSRQRLGY